MMITAAANPCCGQATSRSLAGADGPDENAVSRTGPETMTDRPVILDRHRGMAAQKATEIRRLLGEVAANEKALRQRQEELEAQLIAAPATTWLEVAEKARYLLGLLASTSVARDPRRQQLIANVLEDFARLVRIDEEKTIS
jgi:hypothetical protein